MKIVIEVEDDIPAAVELVKWYRGGAVLSDGNVVSIKKPGLTTTGSFEMRILDLKVEL